MKSYHTIVVFALVVIAASAAYTNTTSFWQTMLNDNEMHFQVYSGILYIISGYEEVDWYYPRDQSGMFYNLFSAMGHKLGPN